MSKKAEPKVYTQVRWPCFAGEPIVKRLGHGDMTLFYTQAQWERRAARLAPQVVNFRDVKQHWNKDTQAWDDARYVYIGRYNSAYNLPASKWANHYTVKEFGREGAIERYAVDMQGVDVSELIGKILVCWCKKEGENVACHGDTLVSLVASHSESVYTESTMKSHK